MAALTYPWLSAPARPGSCDRDRAHTSQAKYAKSNLHDAGTNLELSSCVTGRRPGLAKEQLVFQTKSNKKKTFEKILTGAVFGGIAITASALLWPTQASLRERIHAKAPIEVSAIEVADATEAVTPVEVTSTVEAVVAPVPVEVEAQPVAGIRPVVALQHADQKTDFVELALDQIDRGDLEGAFNSLRKHIYDNEPTPELLREIGVLGRQAGELAVAEQALLDAGALDPYDAGIQIEMARLHVKAGDLGEARTAARQAIRIDGENAMAWNLAGRVAMGESHWQRAEAAFRRAAQLDPTNPMIRNNLGLLFVKARRGTAAVDALETAVELFDDEVPHFVYNNLGLAYEMKNDLENARDAYEQALVANPLYSRARLNLERALTAIAQLEQPGVAASPTAPATAEPAQPAVATAPSGAVE